jgi:hypothetical protein
MSKDLPNAFWCALSILSSSQMFSCLAQVGITSGAEREQEDFMYDCGDSDVWRCFGREKARSLARSLTFCAHAHARTGAVLQVGLTSMMQAWDASWDASVRAKLETYLPSNTA